MLNNLIKIQKKTKHTVYNFELVRCLFLYNRVNAISTEDKNKARNCILELDERNTKLILKKNLNAFKSNMISQSINGEVGSEYIISKIEKQLTDFCKQLSLFN